jgi:hypothetical protein
MYKGAQNAAAAGVERIAANPLVIDGAMARRVVLIVLGSVILLLGLAPAIAGGAELAFYGSSDTLNLGIYHFSTPTRALVLTSGSIHRRYRVQAVFGKLELRLTATQVGPGRDLFLGIGPTTAVRDYLKGVSHETAIKVSVTPFNLTLKSWGGKVIPQPPGSRSFWMAKASGSHPTLVWTLTSTSYRVVAMNADTAASVSFACGLAATIPHLFAIGTSLLAGGIVIILIAITLIRLGARTRTPPQPEIEGVINSAAVP